MRQLARVEVMFPNAAERKVDELLVSTLDASMWQPDKNSCDSCLSWYISAVPGALAFKNGAASVAGRRTQPSRSLPGCALAVRVGWKSTRYSVLPR